MKIDLLRDRARDFPAIERPLAVTELRVWHCKYRSLAALAGLANLEALVIATYPDASLAPLAALKRLRYLSILHLPKVTSLEPLSDLSAPESLSLATSPGWDASRKRMLVSSFAPLAKLPRLRHLELFGIVPSDGDVQVLKDCAHVLSARFSGLPHDAVDGIRAEKKWTEEYLPSSSFD